MKKHLFLMTLISIGYLCISYILIGFKTDQLFLLTIINLLYFASTATRKLLLTFVPFIVFWVLFDYMKAFPNYAYNDVSIEGLYNTEKTLFGFMAEGFKVTPNEYFAAHTHTVADFLSGFFYLTWVPVPILLTVYFFFTKKSQAIHLAFTFLWVNLLGFVLYYTFPAAPPWYVKDYGFDFIQNTPGSAAGLARFDELLNISLFKSMYEKSSNVFAAMPSLHASYPLIALFYAVKNRLFKSSIFIAISALGIWFAAVYSNHHYVSDVLGGIACAVVGITSYQLLYRHTAVFKKV